MGKKSIYQFLDQSSERTRINYISSIKKYEEFHGTTMEKLVDEALDEQTQQVPPHLLKIIDRIEDFQNYLISQGMVHGTILTIIGRIKTIYKKNRVVLPYLTPVNPKQTKRREYIQFKDILTKDELRCALKYMRLPAKARLLVMAQGGLSSAECSKLTTRSFIDELKKYHQKDDDIEALEWLADENHPVIWVTMLIRQKTKKPYYAIIGAEAVNVIASAKLYEMGLKKYDGMIPSKLLTMHPESFSRVCRDVNKKCGFGEVAEESKLRQHNLRRFHATNIGGSALSYEENSILSNSEIDEMQGRGKTNVQDTYIKSNPIRQKLLYAKVINNVSLFHEYDYHLTDDDVIISLHDIAGENKKLKKENDDLTKIINKREESTQELNKMMNELGEDTFRKLIEGILNAS